VRRENKLLNMSGQAKQRVNGQRENFRVSLRVPGGEDERATGAAFGRCFQGRIDLANSENQWDVLARWKFRVERRQN
jgi:hypothetical protein